MANPMRYRELVQVYIRLEDTEKRLAKTRILADLIANTPKTNLRTVIQLVGGRVFPPWDDRKIGVASRLIIKAISIATGESVPKLEDAWKKKGDLGTVAASLLGRRKQHTLDRTSLSVDKVYSNLRKLAEQEGGGSVEQKIRLISELLASAEPDEAKYIVRTILEDLRVGAAEGVLRDAIAWAFFGKQLDLQYDEKDNAIILPEKSKESYKARQKELDKAYSIANDYAEIAEMLAQGRDLSSFMIMPGRPVQVMLFQKAEDIEDAFSIVGAPAALEYKYDGFRVQIHRSGDKIRLYTRRLEEVTEQFPDIVEYAKQHIKGDSYIIDSEAVGYNPKGNNYLPFQSISQRIRRKHDIEKMAKLFPVEVNAFDLLFYEKSLIDSPFSERRKLLSKAISPAPRKILPSRIIVTDDKDEAKRFYDEALDKGNEGIMAKSLNAVYQPGKRVGYGVKIKPVMDSLDLVIVGAEWGEGKRARLLTSYRLACRAGGGFKEIGRVSTGLKELEEEGTSFSEMTSLLKPLIIEGKGKEAEIKPKIVIEVHFEEIQESNSYSSGFALRFPRFVRLRSDRGPNDIDTIDTIKDLFLRQRKRQ